MYFGLTTGLTAHQQSTTSSSSQPAVFAMLGDRDGFAIDFKTGEMRINDASNPANAFVGHPEARLTKWGSDPFQYDPVRGLEINASRDFSIALDTTLFPYNSQACTMYVKYRLNSVLTTEQRYLIMADNAGVDRFTFYAPSDRNFRFASGDGISANISLTDFDATPDTEHVAVIGIDQNGKTFVDENGVQEDSLDVLAASTPSHIGIGGYPDRVLRVLDGFISEIVVVCEPVQKNDRLSLTITHPVAPTIPDEAPSVFNVLGSRDGFAIDFVSKQMKINDFNDPLNDFEGDPETKLTKFGSDPYLYDPVKGIDLSASRDFSIALGTDLYPFNPNASTVYVKYRLNGASSSEQRYLFMADNAGVDRFATYAVPGQGFRFVTGDGVAAHISVSPMTLLADTEQTVVFGADTSGKSFIDGAGIHSDSDEILVSSTPTHVGIGGYNDRVLRVLDGYITEIAVITEPVQRDARQTLAPFYTIYKAEGDSHTFNTNEATWGVGPGEFYAGRVADALGPRFIAANYGWSGDSSSEMVFQLPDFFANGRPDIATIYAGANDKNIELVSDTTPTAQSFSVESAYRFRLEPGGFVLINGEQRKVSARDDNLITLDSPLSTVPQVGDIIAPDTQANIELWIDEVQAKGVTKVAVIGYHFMNFSNGGDTPTYEHPSRLIIRNQQKAAATSRGVPYIDTYAHMAGKITSGEVTLGDDLSWHVAIKNTHLNLAGEQAVADAVHDAFVALGWDQ